MYASASFFMLGFSRDTVTVSLSHNHDLSRTVHKILPVFSYYAIRRA